MSAKKEPVPAKAGKLTPPPAPVLGSAPAAAAPEAPTLSPVAPAEKPPAETPPPPPPAKADKNRIRLRILTATEVHGTKLSANSVIAVAPDAAEHLVAQGFADAAPAAVKYAIEQEGAKVVEL